MTETVSVKMERALLVRIDGLASNRSDFIREAVEEKIRRTRRRRGSVWDTLQRVAGLDIRVPEAAGRVKRVEL